MTVSLPSRAEALIDEAPRAQVPKWTAPMLATLHDASFSDEGWIFERKLDGVRLLGFADGGRVRLLSRNRKDQRRTYPEIVEALEAQARRSFVVDGEVVAFEGKVTSFSRLQGRMQLDDPKRARRSGIAVYYYLFDLLHWDGHDLTALPLRRRKAILRDAFDFDDPLRFTSHRNAKGQRFYAEACRKGWEGLIAKRAAAPYAHSRSKDWLKLKCVRRQELVVGGWTDPKGEREHLGALLVGYFEGERLAYAGKVGTGYTEEDLSRLHARLGPLERGTPPFDARHLPRKGVHWATPRLVAEVGFTEWTNGGRLRHPRFVGLRNDKDPRKVVRERAS